MQKYLCGRCCLKTAQGKGRICSHRGFLARPQTPQQHSRCKPRWTPLHGSCFTISSLNPGIQGNSGAWFYSTSGICPWDMKFVPLEAQSASPCRGSRMWKVFGILHSCGVLPLVTNGCPRFSLPNTQIWVLWWPISPGQSRHLNCGCSPWPRAQVLRCR